MTDSAKRKKRLGAVVVQAGRVALVASLLMLVPSPVRIVSDGSAPPSLEQVQRILPAADAIDEQQDRGGFWPARDSQGETIGLVARTLPAATDVVGYRGPTEALIVLDAELRVVGARLLESTDTQEHVDAILADPVFFDQFRGWPWGGPPSSQKVDAVSGATLTSMALAQGVLKRIGGDRPSLVFPDELAVEEISEWFPDAASLRADASALHVLDSNGVAIGRVLRSGVLSDSVDGYQGPTELIWKLSEEDRVEALRIRTSYDNEPYVRYVREEYGFWPLFEGQSVSQLAQLDPQEEGIEGVSGATMTSLAVADTIVATAQARLRESTEKKKQPSELNPVRWTTADVATAGVLVLAGLLSRFGLFRRRWPRRVWLVGVTLVIGFWAGNLISLALVAGWSAEGIAWRLAPGLTAVAAAALLIPPMTKRNPYCNHLCPHGALQQLVRPSSHQRRIHLSRRWSRWLARIPGLTLVSAYVALTVMPSLDLSSWEPFHAYLIRIAGWGAIGLAAATIALARFLPMGYCRMGCPTGRLIDYLRRSATSYRIQAADGVAAALLVFALGVRWFN